MKIAVINGSVREKNYTGFALDLVIDELESNNIEVISIDLRDFSIPFPGLKIENDNSQKLRDLLATADAFVIGTPEYNGSFTAVLKNMIDNLGYPTPMKGKPIGLLGVASGKLGATKSLEHLRSVCSHIGGLVLPRVVSIAGIEKCFDAEGICNDEEVEKEIRVVAKNLIDFLK
ncbi:MAG: NAD(P)H-dependent oxidoreductase [Melioribacteraceae bacterium]